MCHGQGSLGDCWFMAAMASLAESHDYLAKVVPPGQSFHTDYAGIFLFRSEMIIQLYNQNYRLNI